MRIAGRIYLWIIISVVLQLIVISFFNYIYLPGRGKVEVVKIDEGKLEKDVKFKIPQQAPSVQVSFEGLYAAYLLDGKLEIFDVRKNKSVKTISPLNMEELSYFRWLPDRNMIIYSSNGEKSNTGNVQISTFDIESGEEKAFPKIASIEKNSEVTDIELSPLTNIVYAFIKTGNNQAKVYQFDIMSKIRAVFTLNSNTIIKETHYSDKLVYQDNKNKLFVRDGIKNVTWSFPFKTRMSLLGIDGEDKVYTGELNKEGNITKIHYGKLSVEPDKAWDSIVLKTSVLPQEIIVTRQGVLYNVVEAENAVYSIPTYKKLEYKGKFVEILDGYIVSIEGNELELTVIKM